MKKLTWFAIVLAILPASVSSAPRGLYGKHVKVSWTEARSQRNAGQTAFHPVSIPYVFTFYVGTEGHVFKRLFAIGSTGRAQGSQDRVGNERSGDIGATSANFSGNTLTSTNSFGGAARRMQIIFDANFSSCTAQVTTAKLASAKSVAVRSIATGGMVEFESVSAGPASCSIGQGNPFAN